jgi:hypothetical protein
MKRFFYEDFSGSMVLRLLYGGLLAFRTERK